MADPTIQTFCCRHENGSGVAMAIVGDFNGNLYNIICISSAILGITGAIYLLLPRQRLANNRSLSFFAPIGRNIIWWLAFADLCAALGVLLRSISWITFRNIMPDIHDNLSLLFCTVSSAFIQYFYMATWMWTLCYALDMKYVLNYKESKIKDYHLIAWIVPAVLTATGLFLLYYPRANCHKILSPLDKVLRILPNYLITYVTMVAVMVINPFLYNSSVNSMEKIVTSVSGQHTYSERSFMNAVRLKYSAVNTVFYICWLPNLINGLWLWILWRNDYPAKFTSLFWYIMAFTNPLQAFFNSIVYRKWARNSEHIIFFCKSKSGKYFDPVKKALVLQSTSEGEELSTPFRFTFIKRNGYSTLHTRQY